MILQEQTISGSTILDMRFDHIFHTLVSDSYLALTYLGLYLDHPIFQTVCAGAAHHHYWPGGLERHVKEMIAFMIDQKDLYPAVYQCVSTTDVLAAALLHDFDKIWAYVDLNADEIESGMYKAGQCFKHANKAIRVVDSIIKTLLLLPKYGIAPTKNQWSAVMFAHGGWSDAAFRWSGTTSTARSVFKENKLATLVHMADMFSAQFLGGSLA